MDSEKGLRSKGLTDLHTVGFRKLISVPEALTHVMNNFPNRAVRIEEVILSQALNRILADDLFSTMDFPTVAKSSLDGFAVLAEDVSTSSPANPKRLRVLGERRGGEAAVYRVIKGTAVAVATGAPIPEGADAVVMIEHANRISETDVEVTAPAVKSHGIVAKGADIKRGQLVLCKGTKVRPSDVGFLRAIGIKKLKVVRKPVVGVVSTGNELTDNPISDTSKVVDMNRPMLIGLIGEAGAEPLDFGISRDNFDQLKRRLADCVSKSDFLVVTAGSSVGRWDMVPEVINSLGKPGILFHGVAMRPAMPTGIGLINGKFVFSLPGFPVSAFVAFNVFVKPIIEKMLAASPEIQPRVNARLLAPAKGTAGMRTYLRAIVRFEGDEFVAEPLSSHASLVSTMIRANGILVVPEHVSGYKTGETVEIQLFRAPVYQITPSTRK